MGTPEIMLESSNGVLWFDRFTDNSQVDGTAWYNPETGQGCMFTNLVSTIAEDANHTLWFVARERLYKLSLGSVSFSQ